MFNKIFSKNRIILYHLISLDAKIRSLKISQNFKTYHNVVSMPVDILLLHISELALKKSDVGRVPPDLDL